MIGHIPHHIPHISCDWSYSTSYSTSSALASGKDTVVIGHIPQLWSYSTVVIGHIPHHLLWLVVRTQTPHLAAWFGGEAADPVLLGKGTDTSPLSLSKPSCQIDF